MSCGSCSETQPAETPGSRAAAWSSFALTHTGEYNSRIVPKHLPARIVEHLTQPGYRPQRPRKLAKALDVASEEHYGTFRQALRDLMHEGRVVLGAGGNIVLPV